MAISKVILWDKLTDLVIETLGLSIKRNGNIYQNGVLLDWDNFAYIDLEPIQYD